MSTDLNVCVFSGRLTRDAETRVTAGGTQITRFSLAVNDSYKDKKTDEWKNNVAYLDFDIFNGSGVALAEKCKKGDMLWVQAKAKVDSWEDKNSGEKRTKVLFTAMSWQKVAASGGSNGNTRDTSEGTEKKATSEKKTSKPKAAPQPPVEDDEDDELSQIPF